MYRGIRTRGRCRVVVGESEGDEPWRDLPMCNNVRNHSPDGPEWGYGGSGPAQLALAICVDATGSLIRGLRVYQSFKTKVIAGIACNTWELFHDEVMAAIESIERAQEGQTIPTEGEK